MNYAILFINNEKLSESKLKYAKIILYLRLNIEVDYTTDLEGCYFWINFWERYHSWRLTDLSLYFDYRYTSWFSLFLL